MTNILLSYPRSGNHLCRFFIELLSEIPTYGKTKEDQPIFKNNFLDYIPFKIKNKFNKNNCFKKCHIADSINYKINKFILIIRNPNELFSRRFLLVPENKKIFFNSTLPKHVDIYLKNIDKYNNFKGKKLILYYEDILMYKKEFINKLYNFLELDNEDKKTYVLENIDKLFYLSLNPVNRTTWGGNNSNGCLDFYYKKLPIEVKKKLDEYLNNKLKNYLFIRKKYNI